MTRVLKFELNQPVTIALVTKMALPVKGRFGDQYLYACVDGSRFYASPSLHEKLCLFEVRPDESFAICKRKQGRRVIWDLWLSPVSERQRAIEEQPVIDAELRKAPVIEIATQAEMEQVLEATGTESRRARVSLPRKPPLDNVIPFNVAFREVTAFVKQELADCKEQWNDEARQGAVSTIIIAAAQKGWLGPWER
jgi:hypothetical protein